jgi:hypothetical protein
MFKGELKYVYMVQASGKFGNYHHNLIQKGKQVFLMETFIFENILSLTNKIFNFMGYLLKMLLIGCDTFM